jgi:DNA-binding Xre family transcriptional regulator
VPRLHIPYDALLARKAAREQRVITEREVRDVTGLSYARVKALQRGHYADLPLGALDVLLVFFDCTLDELVQPAPRP